MCLIVMACRDDFAFLAEDDRALWYVGDRPEPASLEDRLEDVSTAATAGALRIRAMYPTGPSPVENLFTDWLARLDMVAATAMVAAYGSAWGPSDFTITRAQLLDSCLIVVGDLWDELRRLLGRDGDPAAAEPTEAAPVQAGAR